MIAVCPSCHDCIHHGEIVIDDATLYRWKSVAPSQVSERNAALYSPPSAKQEMVLGTIAFSSPYSEQTIFKISDTNTLSMRVLDGDILQVSTTLSKENGDKVLRVVENNIRVHKDPAVRTVFEAGRVQILLDGPIGYLPSWAIDQVRQVEPQYARGALIALDIEILRPGMAKVRGFWTSKDTVIIATEIGLHFCDPARQGPITLSGESDPATSETYAVLKNAGPITSAFFV